MQPDTKKILKISLVSILFVVMVIFVFFNTRDLIFGVKIKNVNIRDNIKTTEGIQKITGQAKHAVKLALNGREIPIDQQGNFSETIVLLSGYNVINLTALDKFGHSDEKNYKLIYEPALGF